jgi:dolichol-phosphate mannosyltransferase
VISVIVPARDEPEEINEVLDDIWATCPLPCEVLVVVDSHEDSSALAEWYRKYVVYNTLGPGPANAIRAGLTWAAGDIAVVMCADGSDDPEVLPDLVRAVNEGAVVAAASRYMPGGRHIGGPKLKHFLSWLAGWTLYHWARAGTRDATNAYKAYSMKFLLAAGIDSRHGFEMGIEMVAKARRAGLPVAEVPVTWKDRAAGQSHFRLAWVPRYLRWWWFAFGPHGAHLDLRPEQP